MSLHIWWHWKDASQLCHQLCNMYILIHYYLMKSVCMYIYTSSPLFLHLQCSEHFVNKLTVFPWKFLVTQAWFCEFCAICLFITGSSFCCGAHLFGHVVPSTKFDVVLWLWPLFLCHIVVIPVVVSIVRYCTAVKALQRFDAIGPTHLFYSLGAWIVGQCVDCLDV